MFPIIPIVGSIKIYSFGIFAALSLLTGLFVYWRTIKAKGYSIEEILDCAVIAIVAGLFGARLLFVLFHPLFFWPQVWRFFDFISYGGFVYYGGLVGGIVAIAWYCRMHKFSIKPFVDAGAVGVSFGHAVGLLGAFLSGSAYGGVTQWFWGVPMVGLAGRRHPVQLVELLGELLIFSFLIMRMRRRYTEGMIALSYIVLYALMRIAIEFFRGDSVYWVGVKSQWVVSIVIVAIGLVYWYKRFYHAKQSTRNS